MNVLVDTSVWSLVLRRDAPRGTGIERELAELIVEGRVCMLGPIRQEMLSGIREQRQYESLRERLHAFQDLVLQTEDYEEAASCFNQCRTKGIQGSNTDFLICAVSLRRRLPILTSDGDFHQFCKVLPLKLYNPR